MSKFAKKEKATGAPLTLRVKRPSTQAVKQSGTAARAEVLINQDHLAEQIAAVLAAYLPYPTMLLLTKRLNARLAHSILHCAPACLTLPEGQVSRHRRTVSESAAATAAAIRSALTVASW